MIQLPQCESALDVLTPYFLHLGSSLHEDALALAGGPVIPVVSVERDVVADDDAVGTYVAHVPGGVEWREVGALMLLLLLLLRLKFFTKILVRKFRILATLEHDAECSQKSKLSLWHQVAISARLATLADHITTQFLILMLITVLGTHMRQRRIHRLCKRTVFFNQVSPISRDRIG